MSKFNQAIAAAEANNKSKTLALAISLVLLTVVIAIYLLAFRHVELVIEPGKNIVSHETLVTSGMAFSKGDDVYALTYPVTIEISANGYETTQISLAADDFEQNHVIQLKPKPAQLDFRILPSVSADWYLDGGKVGSLAQLAKQVPAGQHELLVQAIGYEPFRHSFEAAPGEEISEKFELIPIEGELLISSDAGGELTINDVVQQLDEVIKIAGGKHNIQLHKGGYQTITETIILTEKGQQIRRNYRLKPLPVSVELDLSPRGGVLIVNGANTEIPGSSISVPYENDIRIEYRKPGYASKRSDYQVAAGESVFFKGHLKPIYGTVKISGTEGAQVSVNGRQVGVIPTELRLLAVPTSVFVDKKGFRSQTQTVKPTSARLKTINFDLTPENRARLAEAKTRYATSTGLNMVLVQPKGKTFQAGGYRHEQGQRANEFIRTIKLTKPFYVATTELREKDFSFGKSRSTKPVTNKPWDKIAVYCNALSRKEGLEPFYKISGNKVNGFDHNANGYRLISEAEWEYMARVYKKRGISTFVWGDDQTVPENIGNLADQNSKDSLNLYIPGYNDRDKGLAGAAQYEAGPKGFYDFVGNASEWVHDVYSLAPPNAKSVQVDPLGNQQGSTHTIKGSSYKSASLTELRSAFRDGSNAPRDDLGFRLARYL